MLFRIFDSTETHALCIIAGTADVYRTLSEMEKMQFRMRFDGVCKNLQEMDKYLGMFMAATKDMKFVTGVVNMVCVPLFHISEMLLLTYCTA